MFRDYQWRVTDIKDLDFSDVWNRIITTIRDGKNLFIQRNSITNHKLTKSDKNKQIKKKKQFKKKKHNQSQIDQINYR